MRHRDKFPFDMIQWIVKAFSIHSQYTLALSRRLRSGLVNLGACILKVDFRSIGN